MLPFQKTAVYQKTLDTTQKLLSLFERKHSPLKTHLEEESLSATTNIAKALGKETHALQEPYLHKSAENLLGILALLDIAERQNQITQQQKESAAAEIHQLRSHITNFKSRQRKILILSANAGCGHMSAANAVSQAIQHMYGHDYAVEVVDFIEILNKILSRVTRTSYENSVLFAPPIYKFLYESTNKNSQIVKLLNQLNYPFVFSKLKKFFKEQQADLLVSTFPFWDYLAAEVWKKYHKNAKFINIITDSIEVHSSWFLADSDFHIVSNEDTAAALKEINIAPEKIKVLGFPVKMEFLNPMDKKEFLKEQGLNPKNFTILFLATSQSLQKNRKIFKQLITLGDKVNIILIMGRDEKNEAKLKKYEKENSIKVIGWTDQMASFIKSADVVVTKAGGAITMECLAAQKPIIITSMIPGGEKGNAELIKRHNLGLIADSPTSDIVENIQYVQNNYDMFIRNIQKISNPQASLHIAKFLVDEVNKTSAKPLTTEAGAERASFP